MKKWSAVIVLLVGAVVVLFVQFKTRTGIPFPVTSEAPLGLMRDASRYLDRYLGPPVKSLNDSKDGVLTDGKGRMKFNDIREPVHEFRKSVDLGEVDGFRGKVVEYEEPDNSGKVTQYRQYIAVAEDKAGRIVRIAAYWKFGMAPRIERLMDAYLARFERNRPPLDKAHVEAVVRSDMKGEVRIFRLGKTPGG